MKTKGVIKKILAVILSIISILSLASCGAGDVGGPGYTPSSEVSETESQANLKPVSEYSQDFDGMLECMKDRGYVDGTPLPMSAYLIGAERGYRYQYAFKNSNITIEFYEYNTNDLNDTAQDTIKQVNENNHFNLQDDTVEAVMSNNNTCLMIYNYSKSDDANLQRAEDVKNLLKEFKTL